MLESRIHKATALFLSSAIRISPPYAREWGQAMLGELGYVEGTWGPVGWVLGCVGVLARHILAYWLIPGARGRLVDPGGELFSRSISLRKAAFVTSAGCVLGALIFLAAPPFRQALGVAFSTWAGAFRVKSSIVNASLQGLAARAEQKHDAEGLAFCAMRVRSPQQSARLAEEAVHLDPGLLWVYAAVAVKHPGLPETAGWVSRLERSDPQNAFLPMIVAESNDIRHVIRGDICARGRERDPIWRNAMAASFKSARFDDYLGRAEELDRKVVLRYRYYKPEEVLFEGAVGLPTHTVGDCRRYAASLLHSAGQLESHGDGKGAAQEYYAIARFGQVISSNARTCQERLAGGTLQVMAFKSLQALSVKEGNGNEAALFGYMAAKLDPVLAIRQSDGGRVFDRYICERNARAFQIFCLLELLFFVLGLGALVILIAGKRKRPSRAAGRPRSAAMVVGMASAVGLLLSSTAIYLIYRPYWYIFQTAVLSGDRSHIADLRDFLAAVQRLPGGLRGGTLPVNLPFYFWTAATALCTAGIVLLFLRNFQQSGSTKGLRTDLARSIFRQ
jgi:hypothetical protein